MMMVFNLGVTRSWRLWSPSE